MKLLQGLVLTIALLMIGQTHSYAKQDPSTTEIVTSSDGKDQFMRTGTQSNTNASSSEPVDNSKVASISQSTATVQDEKVTQLDDKTKVEESTFSKFREIIEILFGVLGVGLAAFCLYKLSRVKELENKIANLQEQVAKLSQLKIKSQIDEAKSIQRSSEQSINRLQEENQRLTNAVLKLQSGFKQLQQQLHSPKQQSAISASQAANRPTTAKPELPVDTLMQEELRPKPTPKAKEEITEFFYFTKASKDNGFNLSEGTKHKENESLFGVAHYSNDEWKFDFISDQSTMSGIIRNIDQMLASVCDIENYVEKNPTSIENISPGKLERNGENLVVIKKAVVRLK